MQHIETVTVGSGGAGSIVFSNIPDTFTDLFIVKSLRTNSAVSVVLIRLNGSEADISVRRLQGAGSGSPSSSTVPSNTAGFACGATDTSSTFANSSLYIPNYRSNLPKAYSSDAVTENNATQAFQQIASGFWNNTAAITSIELYPDPNAASAWVEHSSASLYGITAGSDGVTTVS